jgi:hypothetical protein
MKVVLSIDKNKYHYGDRRFGSGAEKSPKKNIRDVATFKSKSLKMEHGRLTVPNFRCNTGQKTP